MEQIAIYKNITFAYHIICSNDITLLIIIITDNLYNLCILNQIKKQTV